MRKQLVMIVAIFMVLSAVLTACSGGSGGCDHNQRNHDRF